MSDVRIDLTREPVDTNELCQWVQSTQAGAVVMFLGTVRELTGGRKTIALDYEAYPEMARKEMARIAQQACEQWPLIRVGLVHRFGRLELGEVSVAVAVSSPHRGDAFESARFLIDTLKQVVPIWKQENWADGTTEWVDPTA